MSSSLKYIVLFKGTSINSFKVIPTQAGIQYFQRHKIPAFAGMTIFRGAQKFILLVLLLSLAACSSWQARYGNSIPDIPLLPPSALNKQWQVTQRVSLSQAGLQTGLGPFIAAWSVADNNLGFVGMTPTGQTLMKLHYDGHSFSAEYSPMMEKKIPGRAILAQLQLAYWPFESIDKVFQHSAWSVKEKDSVRSLYYRGRKVLEIVIAPTKEAVDIDEQVVVTNHVASYELLIDTLTWEKVP